MAEKIIQLNEGVIKQELGELVRDSVEKSSMRCLIRKPIA